MGSTSSYRFFPARYHGSCASCHGGIEPGDELAWAPGEPHYHRECFRRSDVARGEVAVPTETNTTTNSSESTAVEVKEDERRGLVCLYLVATCIALPFFPVVFAVMFIPIMLLLGVRFLMFLWDAMFGPGDWPSHF